MRKIKWFVLLSAMMLLSIISLASAVDKSGAVSGASLVTGVSNGLTKTSAGSDGAQGGNVTTMNLSSTSSTIKWSGYYGQVSASLSLGIGSNALFSFGAVANDQIKTVIASQDSAFDFSKLAAATVGQVDTAFGFTTGDIDSATTSYTDSNTVATVASVPTVPLNSYTAAGVATSSVFDSGLLNDGSSSVEADFAFGVPVVINVRDFANSSIVDYELLVPVSDGATGVLETYYFFLDIE
jgi:hypothetical protein